MSFWHWPFKKLFSILTGLITFQYDIHDIISFPKRKCYQRYSQHSFFAASEEDAAVLTVINNRLCGLNPAKRVKMWVGRPFDSLSGHRQHFPLPYFLLLRHWNESFTCRMCAIMLQANLATLKTLCLSYGLFGVTGVMNLSLSPYMPSNLDTNAE